MRFLQRLNTPANAEWFGTACLSIFCVVVLGVLVWTCAPASVTAAPAHAAQLTTTYHTFNYISMGSGVYRVQHGRSQVSDTGPWLWAQFCEYSGTGAEDDAEDMVDYLWSRQTLDSSFGERVSP